MKWYLIWLITATLFIIKGEDAEEIDGTTTPSTIHYPSGATTVVFSKQTQPMEDPQMAIESGFKDSDEMSFSFGGSSDLDEDDEGEIEEEKEAEKEDEESEVDLSEKEEPIVDSDEEIEEEEDQTPTNYEEDKEVILTTIEPVEEEKSPELKPTSSESPIEYDDQVLTKTEVTSLQEQTTEKIEAQTSTEPEKTDIEETTQSPTSENITTIAVEESPETTTLPEVSVNLEKEESNPEVTTESSSEETTTEPTEDPIVILGRSKIAEETTTTQSPTESPDTSKSPSTEQTTTTESPLETPQKPNNRQQGQNYNRQFSTRRDNSIQDYLDYDDSDYYAMLTDCDPRDPSQPCFNEIPPVPSYPIVEQHPTEDPYYSYRTNNAQEFYPMEDEFNRGYENYPQTHRQTNFDSYSEVNSNIDVDTEVIMLPYNWPINQRGARFSECNQPLDVGQGPDEDNCWYFDRQDGKCKWFPYGGHNGNANRFYSRSACIHRCIKNNEDPCSANIECWGSTKCEAYLDQDCIKYQERAGRNPADICPPAQPVCMTRRKTRIQPKIDTTLMPRECQLPVETGTCKSGVPVVRYYFDTFSNMCQSFYYFKSKIPGIDCGGNQNRFFTKDDCMNYCSP